MSDQTAADAGSGLAALRLLVEQWRAKKAQVDSYHATMGIGWGACATELQAVLGGLDARVAALQNHTCPDCFVPLAQPHRDGCVYEPVVAEGPDHASK